MRIAPTTLETSTLAFQSYTGTIYTLSSLTFDNSSINTGSIDGTMSGATAGHAGRFLSNNSTSAYLGLSAEL
jgi:hypothetical protein